jgi:hypothetical protein
VSTAVEELEELEAVPVALGGVRGGPDQRTVRRDAWWKSVATTTVFLTAFVVYSTWAVFQNAYYYVGVAKHRDLISPFYSPCITGSCVPGAHGSFFVLYWWMISPAILIVGGPLSFRTTCYYYRKAYYRSFWQSPPNCAVADGHAVYTGESRFPLILQNIHRYTWFLALVFATILTIDAVSAFRLPGDGGIGVSVGTLVLVVNAVAIWLYTLSCHFCRHFCGGNVNKFSKHPIRHWLWKLITPLNARHMQFAWLSLAWVAVADLYVRLVASGAFNDPKLF